ncbi:hypothetical protein Noc_2048 [Nitrosococcus oceani ATCC 19707]|uniref:Uncharacterized protein n=2 Tax=Nitrosococcus oceani TaxID=1229 RepID=Q3J9I8_NITOC|nr:hypothetical protein Noc_2048 [Nitrosococcus oceani ATCC 19707]KFI19112.1 hypothetical protein IB75_10920 [Nitrosococcus oceani C-27]KFI22279.1 hypothetical protein HW44_10405 [Nitrosococcus oceani]
MVTLVTANLKKIASFSSCGHRQLALIWKYFTCSVSRNESIFNFLDDFPMNNIIPRLKQEILTIIPPTIFFFATFQLIAFTRALMLEDMVSKFQLSSRQVSPHSLFPSLLSFVNRFPEKPLIYNVVWKTAIYITATFIVRYVEHLIPFIRKHGDLVLAIAIYSMKSYGPISRLFIYGYLFFLRILCHTRTGPNPRKRANTLHVFWPSSTMIMINANTCSIQWNNGYL